MNTVWVLLLTFFLHGGMVTTKTILSHSQADCEGARPLIIKEEMTRAVRLGPGDWMADNIKGDCIRVTEAVT